MGMKLDRALRLKSDALMSLNDCYASAMHFGPTSSDLNAQVAKIRARLAGGPRWLEAEFSGYNRALSDALYHSPVNGTGPLVYGGYLNGKFYSCHRSRPDYYEKHGIEPVAWAESERGGLVSGKGHYWSQFDPPRPFFVDEERPADSQGVGSEDQLRP